MDRGVVDGLSQYNADPCNDVQICELQVSARNRAPDDESTFVARAKVSSATQRRDPRVRIRALMILLSAEGHLIAAEIATIVRQHEETGRRWLVRYAAEGTAGLADAARSGTPPEGLARLPSPPARVRAPARLIPSPADHHWCAHSRKPMDMMVQG
jgi:hypothetical protein